MCQLKTSESEVKIKKSSEIPRSYSLYSCVEHTGVQ